MPGIYGYIKKVNTDNQLLYMTQKLNFMSNLKKEDDFIDDFLEASHMHIGNMTKSNKIFLEDGIYISIEGEKYNGLDIAFNDMLFDAYKTKKLEKVLKEIDGYFNVIIYDSNIKKVYLISDRYGMRMMYYYFKNDRFAWSAEVKGLLGLDFVDQSIDEKQIDCFMDLGYLLEDNTFHKHIKLIKPATIMEFDINTKELTQKYYWKWSNIKQQKISFDAAVNKVGELFLKAVDKRFNPNEKVGIALSGGLDSRAIFAAVNTLYPNANGYAYTFGTPNCDDIVIAKKVISKTKWNHKIFYFTKDNWFYPRIKNVINTDGMLNLMHMHGSEFLNEISENIDFNLNGYAGDIVLGGGWFDRLPMNERATEDNLHIFYYEYIRLCNIKDNFYNIAHAEPYLYMNRVRRFTNMGTVNGLHKVDQRKPFFDNDLIEFIYSIPDEYRVNNKLYSAMLLKFFPKFFKDIPWQKTGKTIDKPIVNALSSKIINKIKRIAIKLGLQKDTKSYVNYQEWIKDENILKYLYELLNRDTAVYSKYIKSDFKNKFLIPHLNGKENYIEKILRASTVEIYLKNVLLDKVTK